MYPQSMEGFCLKGADSVMITLSRNSKLGPVEVLSGNCTICWKTAATDADVKVTVASFFISYTLSNTNTYTQSMKDVGIKTKTFCVGQDSVYRLPFENRDITRKLNQRRMLHCKTFSIYCVIKTYYIYIQLRNINLLEPFDEIDSKYGLRVIFLSLLLVI
jgi:hypothetical protein